MAYQRVVSALSHLHVYCIFWTIDVTSGLARPSLCLIRIQKRQFLLTVGDAPSVRVLGDKKIVTEILIDDEGRKSKVSVQCAPKVAKLKQRNPPILCHLSLIFLNILLCCILMTMFCLNTRRLLRNTESLKSLCPKQWRPERR